MNILKQILNFIFNALLVADEPAKPPKVDTFYSEGEYAQMSLNSNPFDEEEHF